ncbi:zonular occludens toxin domain-containing protein [Shewanella chilikensis]|uniref:Zona occludens toxin-like protein n=1 Tax=Shewanella chilikensis TaxID=558541 RepID=A0A6G7LSA5_9GAMM|nr:zonular occludens toxin domain-containing protein [Shewanella chilikensis]QIJ04706.1 zona occludens toxin-like protein [Shewanella chilikensis]
MASILVHGAPGSYKSASTLWFELLPALREGRLVITNIEGLKPLETIESILGEKFPESAKLWRISTQNERGLALMRRFYCWAPLGAFIVIDEVQGVYPSSAADKGFRIEELTPIPPDRLELPEWMLAEYYDSLDKISPETLSEGDVDDLGLTLFDDNGHILYPSSISDAFNRHRKYNWDIVCATPYIAEVHALLRGVSETAYAYKHNDALGKVIPYFARRPRIYPHKAKENGNHVPAKAYVFSRKVPLEVFKLYKSTSTGAVTDQSKGATPLSSPKFLAAALTVVCCIGWFIYSLGFASDSKVESKAVSAAAPGAPVAGQGDAKAVSAVSASQAVKGSADDVRPVNLPWGAKEVYLTGVLDTYNKNRFLVERDFYFELRAGAKSFSANSDLLASMGFSFEYKSDCLVVVRQGGSSFNAVCLPHESFEWTDSEVVNNAKPSVSLF